MFWEIASIILQVAQLGFYITAVDKYKDKLEDLAQWLCDCAEVEREKYESFRDCDPDFYAYYKELADYAQCESNIKRNKGEAWRKYGVNLKRAVRGNRGYTPLANVYANQVLSAQPIAEIALNRASTTIRERGRVNNHILERWSAIVSAPVAVEGYQPAIVSTIIADSFKNLKGYARGFNSAGAALGNSLFNLLN